MPALQDGGVGRICIRTFQQGCLQTASYPKTPSRYPTSFFLRLCEFRTQHHVHPRPNFPRKVLCHARLVEFATPVLDLVEGGICQGGHVGLCSCELRPLDEELVDDTVP